MPTFQNRAALTLGGNVINSNVVQGEVTDVLQITKTAIDGTYGPGDTVTYAISVVNTGNTPYTGLTLSDNLGAYEFNGQTLTPLDYVTDSLHVYSNGALISPAPAVTAPFSVAGLTVPAGGNLLIVYSADVNRYASLAADGSILNTASIDGAAIGAPLTATETVNANTDPILTITKAICPATITENGTVTYTFVIQNTGNTPVEADAGAVITDTFETTMTGMQVTFNGQPWAETTNYTYDNGTGLFTTVTPITVPAADVTQDPTTGEWNLQPGVSELVITATGVQVRT